MSLVDWSCRICRLVPSRGVITPASTMSRSGYNDKSHPVARPLKPALYHCYSQVHCSEVVAPVSVPTMVKW